MCWCLDAKPREHRPGADDKDAAGHVPQPGSSLSSQQDLRVAKIQDAYKAARKYATTLSAPAVELLATAFNLDALPP
jgi:hypothetical protein